MLPPEIAAPLYQEIARIAAHPQWSAEERVLALANLLEQLFVELTKQEQLVFTTLFSRMSYAGHVYNIDPATLRRVHRFRQMSVRIRRGALANANGPSMGVQACAEMVLIATGSGIPAALLALFPHDDGQDSGENAEIWSYKARARVVAVEDKPDEQFLLAIDEEHPEMPVRVQYGLPERNEQFNPSIQIIRKIFRFPLTLSLIEVDIPEPGRYQPRAIVIEPDYLIDISAISECFKEYGVEPYYHLVRKFLPQEQSPAILLGNIANHFLDRLMNEPEGAWEPLFRETFMLAPFAFAAMSDRELREIAGKSQKHFVNLKQMSAPDGGLAKQGILSDDSFLEPSFFSEQYGIQGRLDLFYFNGEKAAIVELKSGAPFKPNSYGLQRSHFTQTLLYDLLVRSVYGRQLDPAKYILYSGADVNCLRFAPTVAPEQWEALQLRNQLLAIERLLCNIKPGDESAAVFGKIRASAAEGKGFLQRDFARFEQAYWHLNLLERKYFLAFTGFIAREQWLAKAGESDQEQINGHAALWRNALSEKQQAFAILNGLEILDNQADCKDPIIYFQKTAATNPLANFRVGDIAVLYPDGAEDETILHYQVIKCTIIELGKTRVSVQLRFRQFNLKPFANHQCWRLEPDLMETGFVQMFRNLLEWAEMPPERRRYVLFPEPGPAPMAMRLLWGPPGTGKTSVTLRDLARHTLEQTDDNLLILAFTNRAVDEICEALDQIGGNIRDQYLRVGARFSTAPPWRGQLLSTRLADIGTRAELNTLIESRRIFTGTVASFSQNDGLLKIKRFQHLIVDEASQLLEPQLIALCGRFDQVTLIGDHRQLPAVTTQRPALTRVQDSELLEIGLRDLRDSYFERLFRLCETRAWTGMYTKLSQQGRMHADIMAFPNRHFYGGMLLTLAGASPDDAHPQHAPLWYDLPGKYPEWEQLFSEQRVVFMPTPTEDVFPGQKTSAAEAALAARLTSFFKMLYEFNGMPWYADKTLGIITPWRAQIAQLRAALRDQAMDADDITIDTVERYQGGARDIIIISCCVHSPTQLSALVSLSEEGVDRKLNVALTRARRHVILLGNPFVLGADERYRAFMDAYGHYMNRHD